MDRYSEAPASGFPPGWSWRTYVEEPYQELVDDTDAVVASVDWGSSPVEYAVGGQTHMPSPEDWHVSPGGNVAVAGPIDVRAAIAEELGFGATPQVTPASGGQGFRDAAREAMAASCRVDLAAMPPTAIYARGRRCPKDRRFASQHQAVPRPNLHGAWCQRRKDKKWTTRR